LCASDRGSGRGQRTMRLDRKVMTSLIASD
jgi:hypothetical protein